MKKAYAIGLDIGGSKIRGILWDGKKVLRAVEKPTPKNLKLFKKNIFGIVRILSENKRVNKIGIGAAGIINNTTIKHSPNIRYIKNLNLKPLLPKVKIRLDNDARAFLRSEYFTSHKSIQNILSLTLGTGIGRAYLKKRKILRIKKLEYPEKWEKEYQKIRNSHHDQNLVYFLGKKIFYLLKIYPADALIVGGGVAERKGLLLKLRNSLQKEGINIAIFKSKLGKNTVAIGALL